MTTSTHRWLAKNPSFISTFGNSEEVRESWFNFYSVTDRTEPLDPDIEAMEYTMFDPQSHQEHHGVLHNWSDKQALQALQALARVRDAVASDSELLVYNFPPPSPPPRG